ncbi:hypothetical protein M5G07_06430 [Serratia symbiotica]|nr:hypothetical protein [Serratia symbiotica]
MSKRGLELCKTVRFMSARLAVVEKELLPISSTLLRLRNVVAGSATPKMR